MALRVPQESYSNVNSPNARLQARLRTRSSTTSPERSKQLETAQQYLQDLGWCIIPITARSKKPATRWLEYQKRVSTNDELQEWFGHGIERNMAVILGQISGGIYVRDFDTEQSYENWRAYDPDLASSCPTVRTARGYHVYFRSLKALTTRTFDDGEFRGDGSYVLLPPSIHENGHVYQWIHRPTFPSLVPTLSESILKSPGFATDSLYDSSSTDPPVAHRRIPTERLSVAHDIQSKRLSTDRVESMSHSQGVRHIVDSLLTESRPADRGAIGWWEGIIQREEFWQFSAEELDELADELAVGSPAFNPLFADTPSQILRDRLSQRMRRVAEELDVEAFDRDTLRLLRMQSTTGATDCERLWLEGLEPKPAPSLKALERWHPWPGRQRPASGPRR